MNEVKIVLVEGRNFPSPSLQYSLQEVLAGHWPRCFMPSHTSALTIASDFTDKCLRPREAKELPQMHTDKKRCWSDISQTFSKSRVPSPNCSAGVSPLFQPVSYHFSPSL